MPTDQQVYDEMAARRFMPVRVNVQVARVCNLRCNMCGWGVWARNKGFMSEKVFDRVIEEMKLNRLSDMSFGTAQGEPLLAPRACDFIDKAIAAGINVEINTNCTPLGDRIIARLASSAKTGRFRVQASFSGYDKESYEFIYAGAKFEDVSRKLKKLYDAFADVGQLKALSIRGCILDGTPVEKHAAYIRSLGIDLDQLGYCALVEADSFAGLVPYSSRSSSLHFCPILAGVLVVYDDGKVSACGCRDSEGVMEIGDILTEGFLEMRNGARFHSFVDAFMRKDIGGLTLCSKCDYPY